MASVFTANEDRSHNPKWINGGKLFKLYEDRPIVHRVEVPPGSGQFQDFVAPATERVLVGVIELDEQHAATLDETGRLSVQPA